MYTWSFRDSLKEWFSENKDAMVQVIIPFFLVLAIIAGLSSSVFIISIVPSASMEPTLPAPCITYASRLAYRNAEPQRGDVVICQRDGEEKQYVKRIIGLPGETVEIEGGITYINGTAIDEPYLNETIDCAKYGPYEVPQGAYFLMGDNRADSLDSRFWEEHYVRRENILAKETYALPLPKFLLQKELKVL